MRLHGRERRSSRDCSAFLIISRMSTAAEYFLSCPALQGRECSTSSCELSGKKEALRQGGGSDYQCWYPRERVPVFTRQSRASMQHCCSQKSRSKESVVQRGRKVQLDSERKRVLETREKNGLRNEDMLPVHICKPST